MNTTIQAVVTAARQLSPREQLEVIQVLSQALQQTYSSVQTGEPAPSPAASLIPGSVHRTAPIADLGQLAADFWPSDESIDDFNTYIAQQRAAERLADLDDPAGNA